MKRIQNCLIFNLVIIFLLNSCRNEVIYELRNSTWYIPPNTDPIIEDRSFCDYNVTIDF